ncbi:MAG TPA: hypothetical protein VFU10_03885 [Gaiellaceae bacterium]|nr:hypothetical protein [Gaiellaceae bacterium]
MRAVLCAAMAGALVLAAVACGGSSSSSDTTSTTTTTTEAMTTASSGGGGAGGKLSASEWAALQQSAAQARSVNQKAIATFQKCRKLIAQQNYTNSSIQNCFGTTTTDVVHAGQALNADLATAQKSASGACAEALGRTQSQVTLYISSVNALGLGAQNVSQVPTTDDIDSTLAQLKQAQTTAKTIAPACAPA